MQGNLRPAVTRAGLALARRRGAATALNPSPTYPAAEYDWSLVDLVVVNRGEAAELGGHEDPFASARALRKMGAGGVALTLGEQGVVLVTADGDVRSEAPAVAAVDTVGAGDVFCGALIAARAAGRTWSGSLRIAVEAAAIALRGAAFWRRFPPEPKWQVFFRDGPSRSPEHERFLWRGAPARQRAESDFRS